VRALRFATQVGGAESGDAWIARARQLETAGYGTLSMPDHVVGRSFAPLVALGAAAAATTRIRLGTLVLDNDFRNPLLVAREAATLDVISNGRFELGIGAGWLDRDYASLGIPFDRGRVRVRRLDEALIVIRRLFTEAEVTHAGEFYRLERAVCGPKPVQRPHPPLLVAGGGDEILRVAARHAQIVAIVAYLTGQRRMTPDGVSLATMRRQIALLREAAGARFDEIELSMFLDIDLTTDRDAKIRELAERGNADPAVLSASMYRVIGTLEDVRAHVLRLRDEVGITYFCLRGPDVDALAPLAQELAGR